MTITTPDQISRLVDICESRGGNLEIIYETPVRGQENYLHHQSITLARTDVAEFVDKLGLAISGTLVQSINQPSSEECPFCFIEAYDCPECEDYQEQAEQADTKANLYGESLKKEQAERSRLENLCAALESLLLASEIDFSNVSQLHKRE